MKYQLLDFSSLWKPLIFNPFHTVNVNIFVTHWCFGKRFSRSKSRVWNSWRLWRRKNKSTIFRSSLPYSSEANDLENEESTSDVDNKKVTQSSKTAPKYEIMKQRITILKQQLKIAEMKREIIKHKINNSKDLQDLRQLKKDWQKIQKMKIQNQESWTQYSNIYVINSILIIVLAVK